MSETISAAPADDWQPTADPTPAGDDWQPTLSADQHDYSSMSTLDRIGDQLRSGWEGMKQGYHALGLSDAAVDLENANSPNPRQMFDGEVPLPPMSDSERQGLRDDATARIAQKVGAIAESQQRQGTLAANPAATAMGEQINQGEYRKAFGSFMSDPLGVLQQETVQGIPGSAPMLAAGAGLGPAGVFIGAYGGDVGPRVYGYVAKALQQQGIDPNDSAAVARAIQADPSIVTNAMSAGERASLGPAAVNTVLMGLTRGFLPGRGTGYNAGVAAGNTALHVAGQPAAEASGQVLGTGEVDNPAAVVEAGLGSLPQTVFHSAQSTIREARGGTFRPGSRGLGDVGADPASGPNPSDPGGGAWRMALGFPQTLDQAEQNYRTLARTAHPDLGGSNEAMSALNAAMDAARQHFETEAPQPAPQEAPPPPPAPAPEPPAPPADITVRSTAEKIRDLYEMSKAEAPPTGRADVSEEVPRSAMGDVPAEHEAASTVDTPPVTEDTNAPAGTRAAPMAVTDPAHIGEASLRVADAPTDGQKAAGNYAKGHVTIGGLPITIENPAGSERSGSGPDGKAWSVQMPADYGYVKRTAGADGDQVDVYLGPQAHEAPKLPVFIVDQIDHRARTFDEHKAMIGFPDADTARAAYAAAFSDGHGPSRAGAVTQVSWPTFRQWLRSGDTAKPYKWVNPSLPRPKRQWTANRPPTLTEFLAVHGGLQAGSRGELQAMDAHRRFVPGFGPLVRRNGGMTLDQARAAAQDAGYLPREGDGVARIGTNEFLDALAADLARTGPKVTADRDLQEVLDQQYADGADQDREQFEQARAGAISLAAQHEITLSPQAAEWAGIAIVSGTEPAAAIHGALMTEAAMFERELALHAQSRGDAGWDVAYSDGWTDADWASLLGSGTNERLERERLDSETPATRGDATGPDERSADAGAGAVERPGEGGGDAGDQAGSEPRAAVPERADQGREPAAAGAEAEPGQRGPEGGNEGAEPDRGSAGTVGLAAAAGEDHRSLTNFGTPDAPNAPALAHAYTQHFLDVGPLPTTAQARQLASRLVGGAIKPSTASAATVDAAVKEGIVQAGRIVATVGTELQIDPATVATALHDLHGMQPGGHGASTLLPGFRPVTDAERAQAGTDRPLTGKSAPMPEDGLFSPAAGKQTDLVDHLRAMEPASRAKADLSAVERRDAPAGWGSVGESDLAGPTDQQRDAIVAAVQKVVGPHVAIDMHDGEMFANVNGKRSSIGGLATGRLIEIAGSSPYFARHAYHEAVHALRNLGVISPGEWAVLEQAARREEWVEADAGRAAGYSDEQKLEEAVAERFAGWATADKPPAGMLGRIWARVRRFFEALRNALAGAEPRSAEGVFEDMRSGKLGEREPGSKAEPIRGGNETMQQSRERVLDQLVGSGYIERADAPAVRDLMLSIEKARDATDAAPETLARRLKLKAEDGSKIASAALAFGSHLTDLTHNIQMMATPMAHGGASKQARAMAKDFANGVRLSQWATKRMMEELGRDFTADQLRRMWDAADKESVARQTGSTTLDGLNTLEPHERAMVEMLQAQAKEQFDLARTAGVHDTPAPLPSYVPRMVVDIGMQAEGKTAHIVRDIRTLALATGKLMEAIRGRELINKIREAGQAAGQATVWEGAAGPPQALDPRTGIRTSTPQMRYRKYLHAEETEEAAQKIKGEDGFNWFTIPQSTAFWIVKHRGRSNETGDPIFERVPIYVRSDFEGPLRAVTKTRDNKVYRAAMDLKGRMMSTIMYGVAHLGVIGSRAVDYNPNVIGSIREGSVFRQDDRGMTRAILAGLVPIGNQGGFQDAQDIERAREPRPGRSWTSHIVAAGPNLISKELGDAIKRGVDAAGHFSHGWMWNQIANIQAGVFARTERRLIAKGELPDVAAKIAAHLANRVAGAIPNEAMSQAARKTANMVLFSRSYRLGNLGAVKDAFNGLPRDVQAQIERDHGKEVLTRATSTTARKARAALMVSLALFYAGGSLMQSGISLAIGQHTVGEELAGYERRAIAELHHIKDHYGLPLLNPFSVLHSLTPLGDNEPGKENRILYGFDKDGTALYFRNVFGKVGEDTIDYFTHPIRTLHSMMSPYMHAVDGLWTGKDSLGREIYDPYPSTPGHVVRAIGDYAAYVFQGMSPSTALKSGTDILTGTSLDPWRDVAKIVAGSVGFSLSKGYAGGPLRGELAAVRRENEFELNRAMSGIRDLIKHGKQDEAVKQLRGLGVQPGMIRSIMQQALNPHSSPEQVRKVFESATPEQRERIQRRLQEQGKR